jgi:hypothetical protein
MYDMIPVTIGKNGMMQLPPKQLSPEQRQTEECRQLKDAMSVCERLGMSTLPLYIRLHEIEDGY